jgi:hypothetical protein
MSFALSTMFSGYTLMEPFVSSVYWPSSWTAGITLTACSLAFSACAIASLTCDFFSPNPGITSSSTNGCHYSSIHVKNIIINEFTKALHLLFDGF